MTDVEHGITAADTAGENLSVSVWQEFTGGKWFWEVWHAKPVGWDYFTDSPEWEDFAVDGGTADTRERAEAAGEDAKESYIRDLIGK